MHLKKSCYPIINYFKGYIDLKVDNKDIDAMIARAKNILSEEKISPAFKAIFEILITLFATVLNIPLALEGANGIILIEYCARIHPRLQSGGKSRFSL